MIAFAKKLTPFKLVILLVCASFTSNAQDATKFPLIPYPNQLVMGSGTFIITSKTPIVTAKEFGSEALELNNLLQRGLGKPLLLSKVNKPHSRSIHLKYKPK
jgi:hexosaminidase